MDKRVSYWRSFQSGLPSLITHDWNEFLLKIYRNLKRLENGKARGAFGVVDLGANNAGALYKTVDRWVAYCF